jgi:hypothetical protein
MIPMITEAHAAQKAANGLSASCAAILNSERISCNMATIKLPKQILPKLVVDARFALFNVGNEGTPPGVPSRK